MKTFSDLTKARFDAMKSDRLRASALALLINETQQIAKSDGNRDVSDTDIILAVTRMVKRTRETLSFIPDGEVDKRTPLEHEIAIVSEFLPKQLSEEELKEEIAKALEGTARDKKAMGVVMKHLSANFKGQYDAAKAKAIFEEAIS